MDVYILMLSRCTCIYVHLCVHLYIYIHVCMQLCMCLHLCMCAYTSVGVHMYKTEAKVAYSYKLQNMFAAILHLLSGMPVCQSAHAVCMQ